MSPRRFFIPYPPSQTTQLMLAKGLSDWKVGICTEDLEVRLKSIGAGSRFPQHYLLQLVEVE